MDMKQLTTFRTVAALGSFSKAADMLDYAQSTISAQIGALETYLGVKLFHRDGKHITLSTAGEQFLHYAQKMIGLEEEVLSVIGRSEEIHGTLSIRVCEPICKYYLPAVLKKFHDGFPLVKFAINSCSPYGLYEELNSGRIDLAVLITRNFKHADLETLNLAEIPLSLVTYPGNPLARKGTVRLIDLKEEPLFIPAGYCVFYKILDGYCIDEKITLSRLYYLTGIEAIKQNVREGIGSSLLPRTAVEQELSQGLLAEVPFANDLSGTFITMLWVKNKRHPPIAANFIAAAKKHFGVS